jgi:hypothetical protein
MKTLGLSACLLVALAASVVSGETPDWSGGNASPQPVLSRGRLFTGQTWWTRFGEPVNSTALAEEATIKAAGAEYAGPEPTHGDGYVFSPGACDCAPPCIGHLWDGYSQNPCRCKPGHLLFNRCYRGCGPHGCGVGNGCGCAPSCSTKAGCDCAAPVGCGCATPMPTVIPSEKQSILERPLPIPESALRPQSLRGR